MKISSFLSFLGRRGGLRVVNAGSAALLLMLGACSDNKTAEQKGTTPGGSGAPGSKLVIKGSNTIGEELGPRLIAEYKKDHPNAAIDLEAKGTGSGFWGLIGGGCDIAAASRAANAEEIEQAKTRGIEFNEHVIGSYSVAVVVNAGNSVNDLSPEQVRDIFTGAVKNWKDVGGSDAPIHVCIRDPISGTYLGFKELAMENKPYCASTNAFTSYSGIIEAVGNDQNAIGYASVDLASKPGVKAASIKGVAPSAAAVNEHKYPYARALRLYTNKSKESTATSEFIGFVESKRGQEIVAQMGNVPKM